MVLSEFMPPVKELASLGAAGLMGALWIWERRLSRTRESQLTEAHERLVQERGLARLMASLIRRNTAALAKLQATQEQLIGLLANWRAGDDSEEQAGAAKGAA